MTTLALTFMTLIWLAGTCNRIYRQARFYQIDEYKNGRYIRWWFGERQRVLPDRTLIAAVVGAVLAFFLSEGGPLLPGFIAAVMAAVASWPPRLGEIKKPFRRTPRASRMLGAAFVIAALNGILYLMFVSSLDLDDRFAIVAMLLLGALLYLSAPLHLMAGNIAMTPVETFFRRRFIAQAKAVMARIQPVVIGITGSYGKTTTKTFLADILNGRYNAYPTPKSYNTVMGICLAINRDLVDNFAIDYFIVEMGAYIRGEIQRICGLTPPHIGIVVEVGPQHLERFGSLENIAIAKYELIKGLPPEGVGIFNWDNDYVREMYERGYPQTRLAVSKTLDPAAVPAGGPRFVATEISESLQGLRFTVTDVETGTSQLFTTAVLGEHNVTNILLATAAAVHEGMSLDEVAFRVRQLKPAESRLVSRTSPEGITIINDAYSANPAGVVSALKVLSMHQDGRRVLITPGMIELAALHEPENRKLGQVAAQHATDVILVGSARTAPIHAGLQDAGFPSDRLQVVETLSESIAWYQQHLKPGDTVLFLNDLPDTY